MALSELEKQAYSALLAVNKATDELFKELSKKDSCDWGIINDGLLEATRATNSLKEAE